MSRPCRDISGLILGITTPWFHHTIETLGRHCESPIEVMLGYGLLFKDKFDGTPYDPLVFAPYRELQEWPASVRLLIPQFQFGEFRIDWVYRDGPLLTFIECDGHDFHERTKAQATRDKQRDRAIQAAGHPILRFTGSEIYKDPFHCADQIIAFVGDRHVPAEFREGA